MNGPINSAIGGQPRLSQRRKDSQKPGELARTRAGKDGERKIPKRKQEPYGEYLRFLQAFPLA